MNIRAILVLLVVLAPASAGELVSCVNKTEYPLQFRFRETGTGRPSQALSYVYVVVPPYSAVERYVSATPGATVTVSAASYPADLYAAALVGGWLPAGGYLGRTVYFFAGYDTVTGLPLVTHETRYDGTGYELLEIFLAGFFAGVMFELFGLTLRIVRTLRGGTGME